jgi:hypothetical protein
MDIHNKASSHAFLLNALLPIPDFIHPVKCMKCLLEDHLYHQCIDIVIEPLKIAACIGIVMSNPLGNNHYCFTPLVSCIVDTPEVYTIACVRGKTSPVTLTDYTQFSDPFLHQPQTKATILEQIRAIDCNIKDLEAYFDACAEACLSGVQKPFWQDWLLSNPVDFLTPEALHH